MPSATRAYDPNNIFAKILRGELPCNKVYEDDKCLVFMDIMPRADGHALVIPKAPSRNILDAAPEDLQHLIVVVQKVARAAKDAFSADGMTVSQFSEEAGGQVVFHTHFHVLPRRDGVDLRPPGIKADAAVLSEHAERLTAALAKMG
jgi:histidine triad (HIT) family protein